ncbi:MAG: DUF4132 domain-containing protein [Firmicutes bacterium]|nr:DUF4132 domain-containing protein [Bacillota bacterium]
MNFPKKLLARLATAYNLAKSAIRATKEKPKMLDYEKIKKQGRHGNYLPQALREITAKSATFEDVLTNGLAAHFEHAAPNHAADLCELVRRLPKYPLAFNSWRHTHRSADPADYHERLLAIARAPFTKFVNFDIAARLSLSSALKNQLSYDSTHGGLKSSAQGMNSDVAAMYIALKIDQNDQPTINALTDAILADNNTQIVDHEIMRAIAMSQNAELHELMRKLLLAARLQEGLRQAIFETADDGTTEYLIAMIKTVLDENLLRFSSAVRAVNVWMGLAYDYSDKRAVTKLLKLGYEFLTNSEKRAAAINSPDVVEIFAAMWAESAYKLQNLLPFIRNFLSENAPKYQKMVGAYFLTLLQSDNLSADLAGSALADLKEPDLDVFTLLFSAYDNPPRDVQKVHKVVFMGKNQASNYWSPYYDAQRPLDWEKTTILHSNYPPILHNAETRKLHFNVLANILEKIPKKGHKVEGKPFDWSNYNANPEDIFGTMMYLAIYDRDEEMLHRLRELYPLAGSEKIVYIIFFITNDLENEEKRAFLFECLSDKSMTVRSNVVNIAKRRLTLSENEIIQLEKLLSLKTATIRKSVLDILMDYAKAGGGYNKRALFGSIERLISDKNANKRLAALDLLGTIKKQKQLVLTKENIREICATAPKITDSEQVLINALLDEESNDKFSKKNGFGLYDVKYKPNFPAVPMPTTEYLPQFAAVTSQEMTALFSEITDIIEQYKDFEYRGTTTNEYAVTSERIFGTAPFYHILEDKKRPTGEKYEITDYVLGDVFGDWARRNADKYMVMLKIVFAKKTGNFNWNYNDETYTLKYGFNGYLPFAQEFLQKTLNAVEIKHFAENIQKYTKDQRLPFDIFHVILETMPDLIENARDFYYNLAVELYHSVNPDYWAQKGYKWKTKNYYGEQEHSTKFAYFNAITTFFTQIPESQTDEEFLRKFYILYAVSEKLGSYYIMGIWHPAGIVQRGLAEVDYLYKAIFNFDGTNIIGNYSTKKIGKYINKEVLQYPIFMECLQTAVNRVIEIELKRGDTSTEVSSYAMQIGRHEGAERFSQILIAMGKETFLRGYTWASELTKRDVLSSLLKASVPAETDTAETLKAALGDKISEKRFLEAVMYVPAWIGIAEEYLGWKGLKSAAWYFHAHTRNSYSAEFETEVAKFSPIDKEDFERGAFDIDWFKDAYKTLGKQRFEVLYDCAKYISSGGTHKRAQLFADAALGKLKTADLEPQINDKRNKDLLLAYSLIPLKRNKIKDALHRYEFINAFLKKSKEFGAQRQASEKIASNIALENLARNFGVTDVLRFNWKMEIEKLDSIQKYFVPKVLDKGNKKGETSVFLEISADGSAQIIAEKLEKSEKSATKKGEKSDDYEKTAVKRLKSVPAALKKEPYVLELTEIRNSLKEQFRRSRGSLEKALENGEKFEFSEIMELRKHPIICPIIEKLVFRSGEILGFLADGGLRSANGELQLIGETDELTIAHSHDLYSLGQWTAFQRYAFDNALIQPFKQIFRELYLVNADEQREKTVSRRYAGHQIQPQKTVALLKGRGWTVDYENGLQKVYYKENIIANMYAMADWFSPADIEPPTIETVQFYDRKTYKNLDMQQINPKIFSEIMRDLDLVVSVAHVGGVDPMASHSTVEMRAVIVAESVRLLKLANVTFTERYAKIKGEYGEYSVHLGSAQVQMMGRGALNILPVYSQHRGRLFLPFLDEDPKTAEIVAKVVMLAEDLKIKDPGVLGQIR